VTLTGHPGNIRSRHESGWGGNSFYFTIQMRGYDHFIAGINSGFQKK
jgi:hypothetical protein